MQSNPSGYDDGDQPSENDALIRRALLMLLMTSSPQPPATAQGSSSVAGSGAATLPDSARAAGMQSNPSRYDDGDQSSENDALMRRAPLMQLMTSSPQSPATAQGSSSVAGSGAATLSDSARAAGMQSNPSGYDDEDQSSENDALYRRALLMQLMTSSPQSPATAQGSSSVAGSGAATLPDRARALGIRQSPSAPGEYLGGFMGGNVNPLSPRAPQMSSAEAYQSDLRALEQEAIAQEQRLTRLLQTRRSVTPTTSGTRQQLLDQLLASSVNTASSDAAVDASTLTTRELIGFHSQFGRGQGLLSGTSTAGSGLLPTASLYPSLADSARRNMQPSYYPQAGLAGPGGGLETIETSQAQLGQKRSREDPSMALSPARGGRPSDQEDLSPWKRRRATKKKPDDMPRRPLSAYNLFFSEERERILRELTRTEDATKEESGEAGAASSSKGEEDSKASSDDERKPAASPTAEPSEDSTEATEPQAGGGPTIINALLKPLVQTGKRKRPHRKTHGKIGFKMLAQMVGQRWRSLPSDRQAYYQQLANADMKRYKQAMEEYYKKKGEKGKKG